MLLPIFIIAYIQSSQHTLILTIVYLLLYILVTNVCILHNKFMMVKIKFVRKIPKMNLSCVTNYIVSRSQVFDYKYDLTTHHIYKKMLLNCPRTLDSLRICGPSSKFLCSCMVLERILVVSPCCSPDAHPLGSLLRCVFGE